MHQTQDLHVVETRPLVSPALLHHELPMSAEAATLVAEARDRIRHILYNEDRRLLVIVGPCSVHDIDAAYEYGQKLVNLRHELSGQLEIIMRVYFEKPRTNVGWKGLINDPHLDGSYDINTGLRLARKLLLDLAHLGLPAATELLDPVTPQYIADLIAWTAIGARTTESQTHREMASGLSMPIGFKNSTDGSLQAAMNAMVAASRPHHFLGINQSGLASIVTTTGNPDGHLVLRGGKDGPNFSAAHVVKAAEEMVKLKLNHRMMVDCSHANANKDHNRQTNVLDDIAAQVRGGSRHILGVMIESHLKAGNQSIPDNLRQLTYGQSVTDACVDFDTTAAMLRQLASAVEPSLQAAPLG
ncbi:3-deoxy-7-phosphoheptulonate synthase [Phormidium tenue]|uniref:Phospho-2-dehydro-3-deoxyheptonate aldolase n=1 Tax=Phormidium tenue NIES-30 TaxID=549789 RepID=A0A1U7IZ28_9CYAN|nr:3-deoxy-7-phosphoheptulonate synthase [Phormidium tenue]MBD2234630.1 3-deoxy-7-phosphoheptulonate synthase [Phormidium tenue FACHB-1052]OKH44058.1 3-deoxy-7-phosphoheptulonate synthase [Phormidium tenue NIES-30]